MISLANHFRSLGPLAEADEERLRSATRPARRPAKGDLLLRAGDPINTLFVLESGWAAYFIISENGRRCITAVLLPGDLIGSAALSTGVVTESVTALTPISVLPAQAAAVRALMHENIRLYEAHLVRVEKERASIGKRLFTVSRSNSVVAVAHLLLDLARRCGVPDQSGKVKFDLRLTQAQIGDC